MKIELPKSDEVGQLLASLLGRGATITQGTPLAPGTNVALGAIYSNDNSEVVSVWYCDIDFCKTVGAALSMLPAAQVASIATLADVPESMHQNLHEIFNINASLLNRSGKPHVVLKTVCPLDDIPPEARAFADASISTDALTVDVQGYGPGALTLLG